jgi:hypothetical protein
MFIVLQGRRRQVALSVSSGMELSETKLSSIHVKQNSSGGKVPLGYCQSLLTGSVSLYESTAVSVHCLPQEERLRSARSSMVALRTPEKKHVARCLLIVGFMCLY